MLASLVGGCATSEKVSELSTELSPTQPIVLTDWLLFSESDPGRANVVIGGRFSISNETGSRIRIDLQAFDRKGHQISSSLQAIVPERGAIRGESLWDDAESFVLEAVELAGERTVGRTRRVLVQPGLLSARVWIGRDDQGELELKTAHSIPKAPSQLKPVFGWNWKYNSEEGDPDVFELRYGDLFVLRSELGHTQPFHFELVFEPTSNNKDPVQASFTGVLPRSGIAIADSPCRDMPSAPTALRYWLPGSIPLVGWINEESSRHSGWVEVSLGPEPVQITLARTRLGTISTGVGTIRTQTGEWRRIFRDAIR